MDDHEIREENVILRHRVTKAEQKIEQLVQALEKRNAQINEWASMYSELQEDFFKAQDAAKTQANCVNERNKTIEELSKMIDELRQHNYVQATMSLKEAGELREDIKKEKLYLVDTLNHILQAKIPAEEALNELGQNLQKKNEKIFDLTNKYKDLNTNYEKLNEYVQKRDEDFSMLQKDNEAKDEAIMQLQAELEDARSGRRQRELIQQCNMKIEEMRLKLMKAEKVKENTKKQKREIQDNLNQRISDIERYENAIKLYQEQNAALQNRLNEAQTKNGALQKKASEAFNNEKMWMNKFQAKKEKAHILKVQLKEAQEKMVERDKKKTKIAVNRMRKIKQEDDDKMAQKELQIQLRQEKERRLDAEQEVFDMKDTVKKLQEEIKVAKQQAAEYQGADCKELVDLLRDLQLEAITINADFQEIFDSIPEEISLEEIDLPEESFCESPLVTKIMSLATQYHIENTELRIVLKKLMRYTSIYKRICNVLAKYPILTTEDIGIQAERGSWVLTADVEHLQRCVIKLHELLIRKNVC